MFRRFLAIVLFTFNALLVTPVGAQGITDAVENLGGIGCNNGSLFGSSLITNICWDTILPIKFMGIGGNSDAPSGAADDIFCSCADPAGLPKFGLPLGAFLPYRLFEVVRNPFCSPTLGGIFLAKNIVNVAGSGTGNSSDDAHDSASMFHVHILSFPLLDMLSLFTSYRCNAGGYSDMDYVSLSEVDPTVTDSELSVFVYPETAMFANPLAIESCTAECAALSTGVKPTKAGQFWCQGCWGTMYPLSNSTVSFVNVSEQSAIAATRSLAVMHRRGLGSLTYGSENMCGGKIYPFLPKEQYKWSQIFPLAEASGNCSHWTGESAFRTGWVWRHIPWIGEDRIFMLWRYTDCCPV